MKPLPKPHKVLGEFSEQTYGQLMDLLSHYQETKVSIFRRAIGTLHFIIRSQRAGGKVMIQYPDQQPTEVVLL